MSRKILFTLIGAILLSGIISQFLQGEKREPVCRTWIVSNLKDAFDEPYTLYEYQRRWLEDESRFKIILKARQIGFSWCIALEALLECFLHGNNVLIASASQLQADEVMDKLKNHYFALKKLFPNLHEKGDSKSELKIPFLKKDGSLSKSYRKIISLPENPRTVEGFTGTVYLDEFAKQQRSEKMYRSIIPSITRSKGFKVRIVSTPEGKIGKFYEIWKNKNDFSKHRVDIHQAITDGYEVDLNELRRNFTADDFAQNYECQFLDANYSFFPLDLIIACEQVSLQYWDRKPRGEFYLGVDIGRKKDLTAIMLLEKIEETVYMRDLEILRNTEFSKQRKVISTMIRDNRVSLCAIDSTGLGMQLSEELKKEFRSQVEPVSFTNQIKEKMVTDLRIAMEGKKVGIVPNEVLREEIHSIKRITTPSGNVRYDGSSKDGHADRFWALALGFHASTLKVYTKVEWFTSGAKRVFGNAGRVFGGRREYGY